jgi:hypothetical protein
MTVVRIVSMGFAMMVLPASKGNAALWDSVSYGCTNPNVTSNDQLGHSRTRTDDRYENIDDRT